MSFWAIDIGSLTDFGGLNVVYYDEILERCYPLTYIDYFNVYN